MNRAPLTRNFFRSGVVSIGGAHRRQLWLQQNPPRHPAANHAWNFLYVPATPKIPARNGHDGSGRIQSPAAPSKLRARDFSSGKRSFTTAVPATALTGLAWLTYR